MRFAALLITLLLAACSPSSSTPPIATSKWSLTSMPGWQPQSAPHVPTLEFRSSTEVGGRGGCNIWGGTYELKGDRIRFSATYMTEMACEQGMDVEQSYIDMLARARTLTLSGETPALVLTLADEAGATIATFSRASKIGSRQSVPIVPSANLAAIPNTANLCRADERVIYACSIGAKLASVCLGGKSVHYRFGANGNPELDLSSTADWSNIHVASRRSQGGLNQDHIRFTNGAFHYVVHAGETGALNERPEKVLSGIAVLKGEDNPQQIGGHECRHPARFAADYGTIHESAPKGWDGNETGSFDQYY